MYSLYIVKYDIHMILSHQAINKLIKMIIMLIKKHLNKISNIKSLLFYATCILTSFMLSGCANLLPESVNISQETMQKKLSEQFPKNKTVLSIYQVTLTNPKLTLEESTNRVKISIDTQINSSIMQTIQGNIQFSSKLVLDDKKQNILLKEPTVDDFYIKDNQKFSVNNILLPALKVGVSGVLDMHPVYAIKPEELTFLGMKLEPIDIVVKHNGMDIKIQAK
ncbi:MAG: hypothetical protein RLZZ210_1188 [Pseudomonadota bacterium]